MPSNNLQNIIALQPDNRLASCPVLLDFNALDDFLDWLKDNGDFERSLREEASYQIGVIRRHIAEHSQWKDRRENKRFLTGLQKQLPHLNIKLLDYDSSKDSKLIDEIHRAYFGGDPIGRNSAELLAYGRRYSNAKPVRIISHHRGFRMTPQTLLYVFNLDDPRDIGGDDNLAYLRVFTALDLHSKIVNAAFKRIENDDYPFAVSAAVQSLLSEFKQIGQKHNLDFALEDKDHEMVNLALKSVKPDKSKGKTGEKAAIQLNDFLISSEWNEQKGYHDICCGVVSAVRNPLMHNSVDEEFLRKRFGNRRKALKFLCLLSLLFEKLDERVWPPK